MIRPRASSFTCHDDNCGLPHDGSRNHVHSPKLKKRVGSSFPSKLRMFKSQLYTCQKILTFSPSFYCQQSFKQHLHEMLEEDRESASSLSFSIKVGLLFSEYWRWRFGYKIQLQLASIFVSINATRSIQISSRTTNTTLLGF